MKLSSDCKADIYSMNEWELEAYIVFLAGEIDRHQIEIADKLKDNRFLRVFMGWQERLGKEWQQSKTILKLHQAAIYRHRQDIKSTRENILMAEDRIDYLEGGNDV